MIGEKGRIELCPCLKYIVLLTKIRYVPAASEGIAKEV
jgi:hypothetical protein